MNNEEMYIAVESAYRAAGQPVIIVGSQSLLGSFPAEALPTRLTLSREVDAVPSLGFQTGADTTEAINRINAAVGEGSPFHSAHGFYVEGVHGDTVILPDGWDRRLVEFTVIGRNGTAERAGWCLSPADTCASKALGGRPQDRDFVHAAIQGRVVDAPAVLSLVQGGLHWGAHTPDRRRVESAVDIVQHARPDA
jgi:hypothetical protein